jgi:hypothetical protein
MSSQKYIYYDYLVKQNSLKNEESINQINDLAEESKNNNTKIIQRIKSVSNIKNEEILQNKNSKKIKVYKNKKDKEDKDDNEKLILLNKMNQKEKEDKAEIKELLNKIIQKDKEIYKLKEKISIQKKEIEKYRNYLQKIDELSQKNEEANEKINQLTEELKSAQIKLKTYNKKIIKSNSIEKYNINIENSNLKNVHKFNKLFSEEEKKALSTLFKSEEELNNFNNKISILEEKNSKVENDLKEQNKQLIKELNDKNEQIKVLQKRKKTNLANVKNNNTIEFLKKEIDKLKIHKFFILTMKKQIQVYYLDGKININNNIEDDKKQKSLIHNQKNENKKNVIKIKKIKGNKD